MTTAGDHIALEALSAFLDGECHAGERETVEQHLQGCPACSGQLEELRLLARATADQEIPPVPAGLVERISQRLDEDPGVAVPDTPVQREERRHLPPWLWRGGPLAAAASFLGAAILWRVWMAGPAPVAPLPVDSPAAPALRENVPAPVMPPPPPAEKKEKQKTDQVESRQEKSAGKDSISDDAVMGFALESEAAAEPAPMDALQDDRDRSEAQTPAPVLKPAPAPKSKALAKVAEPSRRREDLSAATLAEGLAEEDEAAIPFVQEEAGGNLFRLGRDGELLVEAPGYRCRISVPMDDAELWSAATQAASRNELGRLIRDRFGDELKRECDPLPEALLPQN
jgi:hypothetical protein